MDTIKHWSFLICLASIISTFIEFLIPPGKIGKTINFVLGIFGILVFFMPFSNKYHVFKNFFKNEIVNGISNSKLPPKENLLNSLNDQIVNNANTKIESIILRNLKNINVYPKEIKISMDKDDQGNIVMIRCKIFINSEDLKLKEKIVSNIENKLDIKTEVLKYGK